jgi:hypothetical protein
MSKIEIKTIYLIIIIKMRPILLNILRPLTTIPSIFSTNISERNNMKFVKLNINFIKRY